MKFTQLSRVIASYNYKMGIVKWYKGKEIATLLNVPPATFSTYKYRGKIPSDIIIEFAIEHELDLNYIFENEVKK